MMIFLHSLMMSCSTTLTFLGTQHACRNFQSLFYGQNVSDVNNVCLRKHINFKHMVTLMPLILNLLILVYCMHT